MVKIRFVFISFLILVALNVSSQSLTRSVICVTGNSSLENNGLFTYSAGEAISGSLSYLSNGLTQGFQQPSLLFFRDYGTSQDINAVEIYPNPVIDDLTVLFNIRTSKVFNVEVYSGRGTLYISVQFNVYESGWKEVKMGNIPAGLYLLHIYSTDKLIDRVFKIEKM
jgi:hypothetical protein